MTNQTTPNQIKNWEAVDDVLPLEIRDIGALAVVPEVQAAQEEFGRETTRMEGWLSRQLELVL